MVEKESRGKVFILVYRLAIDARTRKGDDGAGGKCLILLKDFQTGTASMARMRHLHQAQGVFIVFVLLLDRGSRSSRGSMGSNPSYPSDPW